MNAGLPDPSEVEKFDRDGYLVLKGYFPNAREFNDTLESVYRARAGEKVFMRYDRYLSLDEIGFTPQTFATRSYSLRIPEVHTLSAELRALIAGCRFEPCLARLVATMAERVDMLQSLYFPFSSQQSSHSDKYLVSPPDVPYRRDTLLGVWLALDATSLENGALYGWPGSHKVPGKPYFGDYARYGDYARDLTATLVNAGLVPEFLFVEPGDVVVWASDWVHGGANPLSHDAPRRALVLHYGAHDAP